MKIILLILSLGVLCCSCSTTHDHESEDTTSIVDLKAVEYNNRIVSFSKPVISEFNSTLNMLLTMQLKVHQGPLDKIELDAYTRNVIYLDSMLVASSDSIRKMSEFDQELKLKQSTLTRLESYRNMLNNEYAQIYQFIVDNTSSDADITIEVILDVGERTVQIEREKYKTQQQFANKYGFELLDHNPTDYDQKEQQFKELRKQLGVSK